MNVQDLRLEISVLQLHCKITGKHSGVRSRAVNASDGNWLSNNQKINCKKKNCTRITDCSQAVVSSHVGPDSHLQPGKFEDPDYPYIWAELVCDFVCMVKVESVTMTLTLKLSTLKGLSGLSGKSGPE